MIIVIRVVHYIVSIPTIILYIVKPTYMYPIRTTTSIFIYMCACI